MKQSVAALTEFSIFPPKCDAATFRNSLAQLRLLCEETPGHLAAFKIEDVAYLSPNIGRVLALGMGSSNSVLDPIQRALDAYEVMQKLTNAEQIAEQRTKLSLLVKKLPDKLELAADMLDVFMQVVLKQKKEKAAIKEIVVKSEKVRAGL